MLSYFFLWVGGIWPQAMIIGFFFSLWQNISLVVVMVMGWLNYVKVSTKSTMSTWGRTRKEKFEKYYEMIRISLPSLDRLLQISWKLARLLPTWSYCRKLNPRVWQWRCATTVIIIIIIDNGRMRIRISIKEGSEEEEAMVTTCTTALSSWLVMSEAASGWRR